MFSLIVFFIEPEYPKDLPYGLIFASFMVSIMIGSTLFSKFTNKYTVETIAKVLLVISAISLTVPVFFEVFLVF